MLNAEKYRKEISKITNNGRDFSVNKHNHEIKMCCASNCSECLFDISKGFTCACGMTNWLLSEYKEQSVKVSKLEYELLKFWSCKEYKYIARDKNGDISIYLDEPDKDILIEFWHGKEYEFTLFNKLFKFVKWEDLEPTSIKEVLENCEVVEDDL